MNLDLDDADDEEIALLESISPNAPGDDQTKVKTYKMWK